MAMNDAQVTMRLPTEFIERADALLAQSLRNPDNVALGIKRASVLRLAMMKGIEVLEREARIAAKTGKK